MNNPDSVITFTELCNYFEEISNANRPDDKKNVIKKLVAMYYTKATEMQRSNPSVSKSFYPVLRLLVPHEERDRGPYNLKEFTFIKTLVNILGLSPKSRDAEFLRNYKASNNRNVKYFTDAAHHVLKQRFNNKACLSVLQVNEYLDEIAAKANEIRAQEQAILRFFEKTSQLEQKWVVRMLLKELRLGIGRDNILKAFHPNAVEFYNNVHSLKKICDSLQDPNATARFKPTVTLFEHFQPMLSTRCTPDELRKAFKTEKVYTIENKFDGERFQLHYNNEEFKYFSRQGFEYSANFEGYTEKLRRAFDANIRNVILDGEMMIWNKSTWKYGCKGMTVDVKKLKDDNSKFTRCFCVFDVLFLNDEVVMDKPLKDRVQLLEEIINPIEGVIVLSQQKPASKMSDVIDALNEKMDEEEEGIVFKDPDTVYAPGSRKGWWKMKLEYFENVMSDLDVIILGGYYGDGYAKKSIQGYLVGVVEKEGNTCRYLSFAKIQTGLNAEERKTLNKKLNGRWNKVSGNEHENCRVFWGKEVPDVWIKPEHSCCLLVRGSELILIKSAYRTPYTLRFPRILKLRLDKPHTDCLTLSELKSLTNNSGIVQKLNKRHLEMSDIETVTKKKSKTTIAKREPVVKKSDVLENREFLVLTGKGGWSKESVEGAIRENGGRVMGAETANTFCMLVGDPHLRVETYKGEIDIVSLDWLRWVLNEGELDCYTPKDVLYVSPKTRKKFGRLYDKFGDSFTEKLNVGTIKRIVDDMNDKFDHPKLSQREIKDLFREMNFEDEKVFRGVSVYFDKLEVVEDVNSNVFQDYFYDEIDFVQKGGTVCDMIGDNCDFVLTKGDADRRGYLENYLNSINCESIRIVSMLNEVLN